MKERCGVVPEVVLCDPKLTGAAVRVYALLAMHAGEKSWCWPSLRRLSEQLHVSRRSVLRATKKLEEAGFITRERHDGRLIYVLKREAFNGSDNTAPLN